MPPAGLSDLIPVSEELAAEAYRDIVIELRAERLAMRAVIWCIVLLLLSYPLDKILNSIGRLITTIRARKPR